jgi:hypothetical protein
MVRLVAFMALREVKGDRVINYSDRAQDRRFRDASGNQDASTKIARGSGRDGNREGFCLEAAQRRLCGTSGGALQRSAKLGEGHFADLGGVERIAQVEAALGVLVRLAALSSVFAPAVDQDRLFFEVGHGGLSLWVFVRLHDAQSRRCMP